MCRKGPDSAFDPAHRAPERFSPVFHSNFPRCRIPEGACAPYPAPVPYAFGRCAAWCRMWCAAPLHYPAPGEFVVNCWAFSFQCPMGRMNWRIPALPRTNSAWPAEPASHHSSTLCAGGLRMHPTLPPLGRRRAADQQMNAMPEPRIVVASTQGWLRLAQPDVAAAVRITPASHGPWARPIMGNVEAASMVFQLRVLSALTAARRSSGKISLTGSGPQPDRPP